MQKFCRKGKFNCKRGRRSCKEKDGLVSHDTYVHVACKLNLKLLDDEFYRGRKKQNVIVW